MRWLFGFMTVMVVLFYAAGPIFGNGFKKSFDPAQVILQIPYGIKNSGVKCSTGLVVQGSRVASLIIVESYHATPLFTDLRVEIPKPLKPEGSMEGIKIDESTDKYILHAKFKLITEFDDWYKLLTVLIPSTAMPGNYSIKATACCKGMIDGKQREFVLNQQAVVRVATPAELQKLLTVREIKIPADLDGKLDKKFAQNSLLLRSDLGLWGKVFGSREESDVAPVSFAGIRMANQADEDAIVLVSWEVLDPKTKKEVQGFRISQEFLDLHGKGEERIQTQVFIPGKKEVEFVLPIFADKDKILPGRYLGRVTSKLFGSDVIVRINDFELTVQKMSWATIGTTVYAIFITLGISIFLLIRNRMIFQRFKTRWLILIALFGSTKFLLSVVPRFFLTELFNGLLGPFAVFATGIFREGITYLFTMALVVLIPFPGVVTLSMLMSLVLFCLLGSFNPVVILFMMVAMSTMEITLYLIGFTRAHEQNFAQTNKALILAALGMGTASAFATFVDYNLYMLLYRLYYAKWYIWANILVVGFFYTSIFAPAGVMLGNKLKQVATE